MKCPLKCPFCGNTLKDVTKVGSETRCPRCEIVIAFVEAFDPNLLKAHFSYVLATPTPEVVVTPYNNLFVVGAWNPEEALPSGKAAKILGLSRSRVTHLAPTIPGAFKIKRGKREFWRIPRWGLREFLLRR